MQSGSASQLLDEFARGNPHDVVCRGGETFVAAERTGDLIDQAEQRGVRVLGLEGFLVDKDAVYVALGRIADLSHCSAEVSIQEARLLVCYSWSSPPGGGDQLAAGARGRHMIVLTLDE